MTATLSPPLRPLPLEYGRPAGAPALPGDTAGSRAGWLDAFRGFVMLCLISRGFGFPRLKPLGWAAPIAGLFDHAEWVGLTPWDMVQPFFMFIVGAAMPFAFAKRRAAGTTRGGDLLHVLKRCGLLLLWAQIAMSVGNKHPTLELINVLAQIAFAYLIAFLVLDLPWRA
jgi:predicted acyltransferase